MLLPLDIPTSTYQNRRHPPETSRRDEPPLRRQGHGAQADAHERHLQRQITPPARRRPPNAPQVDSRIETVDVKIAKLNAELAGYQQRLAKLRDGPGKQAVKQKALKVLQQRKLYEAQRDQLQQQSWNMEQAGMMQDNLKNTMITVDAMKTTTKELRKQYGQVDVAKIERLQDEMADLMDVGNEIQESLGRSYEVPEDVDDAELDAELEALGEEMSLEAGIDAEGVPSYLLDEGSLPQLVDEPPEQSKVKEAAG
jgi:charged multivesicular body protein 5